MNNIKIRSALISVFYKDGLEPILDQLSKNNVKIYSTGGTQKFIEDKGLEVFPVEKLTSYPSILDGRVKTLHPKIFGGILAKREEDHLSQLTQYEIPEIDLVIVDLYPFEETIKQTNDESKIIEKIDIGGIALIRAAAKNFNDVTVIANKGSYQELADYMNEQNGEISLTQRKRFASEAFAVSSHYDTKIHQYFNTDFNDQAYFKMSEHQSKTLRYGENPHQSATFYGDFNLQFDKLGGKDLSYNNLVDIDAAVGLMKEFKNDPPTFAVLKHTNPCGVATRDNIKVAWDAALAGDSVSAFGGILIANTKIDLQTAESINQLFYEVLIAPDFDQDAQDLLLQKKKRILLKIKHFNHQEKMFKSLLNGTIVQDVDSKMEAESDFELKTKRGPTREEFRDLEFAAKCVKHLKSNTIVLCKDNQLIGMGCGQTSRVDACNQAILKAKHFGFDPAGSVMASDAFFPFPDCVEIANKAGITAVVQPGGSIKDQLSIDYCNENDLAMVMTGIRHFKH